MKLVRFTCELDVLVTDDEVDNMADEELDFPEQDKYEYLARKKLNEVVAITVSPNIKLQWQGGCIIEDEGGV